LDDESIKRIDDLRNATNKRIEDLRAELLELRRTDNENHAEQVKVAYEGVRDRMQGFPQQYATKPDMDSVKEALGKLEKDAIPREIYEERNTALQELVQKLDKEKMSDQEFRTFVDNQRVKDEEAAKERRAVASGLASSTEAVATTLATRDARASGASASWKQIAGIVALGITVLGFVLSIVVLASNGKLGGG